jgi:folate-binding protein YgfZ
VERANSEPKPGVEAGRDRVAEGYLLLSSGAGYRVVRDHAAVRVTGSDRITFFQGMCSADVKGAAPGAVLPALILTEHAHVIADFFAWIGEDELLVEIERALWPAARAHLEKLLVADDVEMDERDETAVLEVAGPRANEAIGRVAGSEAAGLERHRFVRAADGLVGRTARAGLESYRVIASAPRIEALARDLGGLGGWCAEAADEAFEIVRVEQGIARVGVDTREKTLALEAGLEHAISMDKGCYVGQETIERATARGALKRKLRGLRIESRSAPARGAAVMLDDRQVGEVGSAVVSPRLGAIALAILHHSAWDAGTRVVIKEGMERVNAVVSELPFRAL